jgi:hypothetical protein
MTSFIQFSVLWLVHVVLVLDILCFDSCRGVHYDFNLERCWFVTCISDVLFDFNTLSYISPGPKGHENCQHYVFLETTGPNGFFFI